MSKSWSVSPLSEAKRAFDQLTRPPVPVAFDGRGIAGLPQRLLDLAELRRLLTDADDPPSRETSDAVWRDLVVRARRDGTAWVIVALGLAVPGLKNAAGWLAVGWHGDRSDVDAEMRAAFLERLHTVDLDAPRVFGRLLDAAVRAGKKARMDAGDGQVVHVDWVWSFAPPQPFDHPDFVLARAVRAAVIDIDEAMLIGETRLDDLPLAKAAADLGVSVQLAAAWRYKAERRLRQAIANGEIGGVALRTRFAGNRDAEARRNGMVSLPPRRRAAA